MMAEAWMMWAAKALAVGAFGWLAVARSHTVLAYFQQEEYDGSRLLGVVRERRVFDVLFSAAVLLAVAATALGGPALASAAALLVAAVLIRRREGAYR